MSGAAAIEQNRWGCELQAQAQSRSCSRFRSLGKFTALCSPPQSLATSLSLVPKNALKCNAGFWKFIMRRNSFVRIGTNHLTRPPSTSPSILDHCSFGHGDHIPLPSPSSDMAVNKQSIGLQPLFERQPNACFPSFRISTTARSRNGRSLIAGAVVATPRS